MVNRPGPMRRGRLINRALGPRALALLLFAAGLPVFAATGTVNLSTPPQQTKRERRPSPAIESLPAPAVSGPLRILLVDDDYSDNNHQPGDPRESPSDTVFRRLAADAVGGEAESWSIETVKAYANGPGLDRLRRFSLILWYTGSSYGGGPDNTSVLSLEDEKTVRRYLEEVGGVVVLFSPGYASKVFGHDSTIEDSSWPFLSEVLGIRGGYGLAKRFEPGAVSTPRGVKYQVGKGGGVETQFSFVNPDGSAVVFTAALDARYSLGQNSAVATAFSYGRGRIIYVGFTFENLEGADLAPAFQQILAATGAPVGRVPSNSPPPLAAALPSPPDRVRIAPPPKPALAPKTPDVAGVKDAPREFTVTGTGRDSFNFSASSPGPIHVEVQSRGVAVTLTVFHPDGRKVDRTGTGTFSFDDTVTETDLAKGHLWGIGIRVTTPTPVTTVLASGLVTVTHPPSNPTAVLAQMNTLPARTEVLKAAATVQPVPLTTDNRGVLKAALTGGMVAPPTSPLATATFTINAPVVMVQAAPPPPKQPIPQVYYGINLPRDGERSFARDAARGVLNASGQSGSTGAKIVALGKDLFPPGIFAFSVYQRPQDYPAELRFVQPDGQEVIVPLTPEELSHDDRSIGNFTEDPNWQNTAGQYYYRFYTGYIPRIPTKEDIPLKMYLKTTDDRYSERVNFTYKVVMRDERMFLPIANGQLYDSTLASNYPNATLHNGAVKRDTFLLGFTGYDTFYNTYELRNGWKVVGAEVKIHYNTFGGAEIAEFRSGTSSPFVKVRWSLDPTFLLPNDISYSIIVHVRGPTDFEPFW